MKDIEGRFLLTDIIQELNLAVDITLHKLSNPTCFGFPTASTPLIEGDIIEEPRSALRVN